MNSSAIRTHEERTTVGPWGKKKSTKTGTWTAELGAFLVQGQPSKAAAVEALVAKIGDFNPFSRAYLFTASGEVFHVYHGPQGWGYDITGPTRTAGTGIDRRASSCWGQKSYEQTIADAIAHIDQSFGGLLRQDVAAA
jgi:hypothetical protein